MMNFSGMYPSIENTTYCGGHCVMCPRDEFSHKFENMSFSVFKKIIDELIDKGCRRIQIKGFGDCLCDSELESKLAYVKERCPDMYLSTINTGHLFNDRNISLVCKYFNSIKISMYGMTKKTYEKVHGGSLIFEEVKQRIDDFLSYRPKSLFTILTFLVLPENEQEMDVWKDYYEQKCDRIDIWKPHNWGGVLIEESGDSTQKILACPRALKLNDLQFCTDGAVLPCCFDFDRHDVLGNVNEMSIEEILKSEKTKRFQEIHFSHNVDSSLLICKNCDQMYNRSDALVYSSDKNMNTGVPSLRK